ncbi:unnamed protein product [Diatraea saccharalis]|uniref:ZZ-type domain-containing protein n=1 Tax=Diatraea saccharalis TaxID=40085 RepID=A0A9N9WKA0_9NEOP|nr:unnamed protein product [Diatraea saccharalis]
MCACVFVENSQKSAVVLIHQKEWLKAGGRDDLLEKPYLKSTHRFCSRHFAPSCFKNKHLCPDAVPTLYLPGSNNEGRLDKIKHHDIMCNSCNNIILGFRYKCVTCIDYDLCPKCEMLETHPQHYMIRIPKPLKFEHIQPDCSETTDDSSCDSSDDEPITKYVKHYDSGVDLSDDVKDTLRKEVARVLKLKDNEESKTASKQLKDKNSTQKRSRVEIVSARPIKRQKSNTDLIHKVEVLEPSDTPKLPEVAFADVNQLSDQGDVKLEVPVPSGSADEFVQPLMHVKLSDDLTELMIEMTQNGQKTVYKYID